MKKSLIITIITLLVLLAGYALFQHRLVREALFAGTVRILPAFRTSAIPADRDGDLHLFLLAGQSNMAGTIPNDSLTIPLEFGSRVFVLNEHAIWSRPDGSFHQWGVGTGEYFTKTLVQSDSTVWIGVIPCALGGTTLSEWAKGSEAGLYEKMLARTRVALPAGELKAILFFQGESDAAGDPGAKPALWAEHFEQWVQDVRADLQQPRLPVLYARINSLTRTPEVQLVRQQQEMVDLPAVEMVSTDNLPMTDRWHFSETGYREIGRRFAEAYLDVSSVP